MDMIKIAMIGLAAVLLAMQVKVGRPEYEIFITMAACLCIFFFLMTRLFLRLYGAGHRLYPLLRPGDV